MPSLIGLPRTCIGTYAYRFGYNFDDSREVQPGEIKHLSEAIDRWVSPKDAGQFTIAALKKVQYQRNKKTFDAEGWVQVTEWMAGRIAIFVRRKNGKKTRYIRFKERKGKG